MSEPKMLLPCQQWLRDNGFLSLARAIRNNPDLFAHIPQDCKRFSYAYYLAKAKALQKRHGKVPRYRWLVQNGERGVYNWIRANGHKHPELIQDHKYSTDTQHLSRAKMLQKKHGQIPNSWWLEQNGERALDAWLRKNRGQYSGLIQDRKHLFSDEHYLAKAKSLQKKHGQIPNSWWLQKNGEKGVDNWLRKNLASHPNLKQLKLKNHGKVAA